MVTNINLSSPEAAEKKSFTGKSTLILSVLLVLVVFAVFLALVFTKNRYVSQEKNVLAEISREQSKVNGTEFSEMLDFQSRLNLLDRAVADHPYWDNLLVKMGSYVIPEVRFEKFSANINSDGAASVEISGLAANLDALSRELILLKDFPGLDSLEFKNAGNSPQTEGQTGGIFFEANLKINKSAFQK